MLSLFLIPQVGGTARAVEKIIVGNNNFNSIGTIYCGRQKISEKYYCKFCHLFCGTINAENRQRSVL